MSLVTPDAAAPYVADTVTKLVGEIRMVEAPDGMELPSMGPVPCSRPGRWTHRAGTLAGGRDDRDAARCHEGHDSDPFRPLRGRIQNQTTSWNTGIPPTSRPTIDSRRFDAR